MRAICEFVEYIKVITNYQDIRPLVTVKFYWLLSYERLNELWVYKIKLILESIYWTVLWWYIVIT